MPRPRSHHDVRTPCDNSHRETSLYTRSYVSASFKRARKRCLICKFEIAANRYSSSDTCDAFHQRVQQTCKIERRRFALDVRIHGENNLRNAGIWLQAIE